MILTYRFRIRDSHSADLRRQSRACNFVWNYCNDAQRFAVKNGRRWLSAFALGKLTAGTCDDLNLAASTIENVCRQYTQSREQSGKAWLRFRGRKSLGWVPFRGRQVKLLSGAFVFRGSRYVPMHERDIPPGACIRGGSFAQDARGRWYINVQMELSAGDFQPAPKSTIGVDLGLSRLATLSDGSVVRNRRMFRSYERRLAVAQRAGKRRQAVSIHAKIRDARRDYLHKESTRIALAHDLIFVGDVSSSNLSQTSFAKSVGDASWSTFRTMLRYKAMRHGGQMAEVGERNTTQTCSSCGDMPASRPRGITGLGIRRWTCSNCGVEHDRDVNAARNIARRGLATLGGGACGMGAATMDQSTSGLRFEKPSAKIVLPNTASATPPEFAQTAMRRLPSPHDLSAS